MQKLCFQWSKLNRKLRIYVSFTFSVWCVFATPNLFLKWSNSVIALKTIISHDITHSFNIQWNHIMLCIMLMQWLSLTTRAAAGMNSLWDMQCRIIKGFMASFHLSVLFTSDMYLIVASLVVRLLIILIEVEKKSDADLLSWSPFMVLKMRNQLQAHRGHKRWLLVLWVLILNFNLDKIYTVDGSAERTGFLYVACSCYIEMCGAINGWKATTDKETACYNNCEYLLVLHSYPYLSGCCLHSPGRF